MADFATALLSRLTGAAPVAAIVGTRVYWGIVPQGATLPYVRLQTISDPRPEHLQGYQGARVTRIQCDCFDKKADGVANSGYVRARDLAEKIIAALATPGVTGGVHFGRVKAEGPRDLGEDTASGYVHRLSLDLLAEHKLV